MALRPELEARVRAVEEKASNAGIRVDELCDSIDEVCESIENGNLEAIPDSAFEDISVVTHTEDLKREEKRVRRESYGMRVPMAAFGGSGSKK